MSTVSPRAREHEHRLPFDAHSELIQAIIEAFVPRFAPGAKLIYIDHARPELPYFDQDTFHSLQLTLTPDDRFPDVILDYREMNRLFLIDAITGHGLINPKRRVELATNFAPAIAELVYGSVFPNRQVASQYMDEIAWETGVWFADEPAHHIYFNGSALPVAY